MVAAASRYAAPDWHTPTVLALPSNSGEQDSFFLSHCTVPRTNFTPVGPHCFGSRSKRLALRFAMKRPPYVFDFFTELTSFRFTES